MRAPASRPKHASRTGSTPTDPAVRVWRLLRRPFPLPLSAAGHHVCEWEVFDGQGMAGCRLCSNVHDCRQRRCTTVETEDAHVCEITGVCVAPLYDDSEFLDTHMAKDNPHLRTNDAVHSWEGHVSVHVEELLESPRARSAFESDCSRTRQRLFRELAEELRRPASQVDLFGAIANAVSHARPARRRCLRYDAEARRRLVGECTRQVAEVLCNTSARLRLNMKSGDLRNTIFGLTYLLKHGIYVGCTPIVPCVPGLADFLPSENQLARFFDFRAKYITDVENKCKFAFRARKGMT